MWDPAVWDGRETAIYATDRFLLSSKVPAPPTPAWCWASTLRFGQRLYIVRRCWCVEVAGAPTCQRARVRPRSMSHQRDFISADQFHPDPFTQSRNAERTLNAAIVHADISRSYEEYLEIFDQYYADDLKGSSETMEEPLCGKERVRSLLFSFLAPLHAMAEVGGVSISIRETAIPGDAIDETHSVWTLELVGGTGKV